MRKALILALVMVMVVSTVSLSRVTLDTLTFYTIDLETGNSSIFPIAYFTFEPIKGIGIRLEDYLALSHDTLNLGPISLMKPRLYYGYYYGNDLSIKIGNFRSEYYNTRKINFLRVGGFYDYNYGAEVKYDYGNFTFLGRYNYDSYNSEHQYGGMISYKTKSSALAFYGMVKGTTYDLSVDGSLKVKLGPVSSEIFGAVAVYGSSPFSAPPTYLIGALADWNKISAGIQYANQGSWSIKYDYSDPNKYSEWVLNTFVDYYFTSDISVGFFLDVNPTGYNYGTKFKLNDLELLVSNGDVDGGMDGIQRLELSYSNYFSIDLEKSFKALIRSTKKLPKIAEIKKTAKVGDTVTIRGIVAVDTGVMGNNVTYVVDETGGYMVWGRNAAGLKAGDEVIITGYIKEYYGILEIVTNSVEKIASGKKIPIIPVRALDVFSGKYESALVKITGTVMEVQKYSIMVKDDSGVIKVYAKKGTNVSFEDISFGQKITVIGIVSLFKGEWEIIPRSQADIQ